MPRRSRPAPSVSPSATAPAPPRPGRRSLPRPAALLPVALLLWGATLPAARAQGNPNADQILNALMPRPGMAGGTRGIRPAGAPPPAPVAPAEGHGATRAALREPGHEPTREPGHPPARPTTVVPPTAPEAPSPSVSLTVQFTTGSAELTPDATRTLDQLGLALSSPKLAGDRFRIEGHTDTVGGAAPNRALSQRRAEAVAAYLSDRFHVARDRLETAGLGEDGLLVPTAAGVAEPRNRRVAVINLGA